MAKFWNWKVEVTVSAPAARWYVSRDDVYAHALRQISLFMEYETVRLSKSELLVGHDNSQVVAAFLRTAGGLRDSDRSLRCPSDLVHLEHPTGRSFARYSLLPHPGLGQTRRGKSE